MFLLKILANCSQKEIDLNKIKFKCLDFISFESFLWIAKCSSNLTSLKLTYFQLWSRSQLKTENWQKENEKLLRKQLKMFQTENIRATQLRQLCKQWKLSFALIFHLHTYKGRRLLSSSFLLSWMHFYCLRSRAFVCSTNSHLPSVFIWLKWSLWRTFPATSETVMNLLLSQLPTHTEFKSLIYKPNSFYSLFISNIYRVHDNMRHGIAHHSAA